MLNFVRKLFNKTPTRQQFAEKVRSGLRQASRGADAEQHTTDLTNLYADYCAASADVRDEWIAKIIADMARAIPTFDLAEVRSHLLPVLQHMPVIDLLRIQLGDPSKTIDDVLPHTSITDTLGIKVAIDSDTSMRRVTHDMLKDWRISFDEALAIATDNLRHSSPPRMAEISPGLWASRHDDCYDAPRMLLQDHIRQLPFGGDPVVMIPNRSCLLVCSANDDAAVAALVEKAQSVYREQPRPLSCEMLRLRGSTWTPWEPEGEAGRWLARMKFEERANDYREEKQAHDQANAKAGLDVHVSSHMALERSADKQVVSYAVLIKGMHTWLPEADAILISESPTAGKEQTTIVRWADFASIAGHLLHRLPGTMPRYEIHEHPDEACERQLKDAAIPLDAIKPVRAPTPEHA